MGQITWISLGIIEIPEGKPGFKKGFLLRDPDGPRHTVDRKMREFLAKA